MQPESEKDYRFPLQDKVLKQVFLHLPKTIWKEK